MKRDREDDTIGKRLRDLRRSKGLHQQDLASDDISSSYVSLIETGKRIPSDAVLKSLAKKLDCTVEYLVSGRNESRVSELQLKVAFGDMAIRNGDNGEALQAYSEALAQAEQLDTATVRRARRGQAQALEKLGRLEAAIPLLHELYEDPETVPGSAEWAQSAVALCRCYRLVGDLALAVELGEAALGRLNTLGLDVTDDHLQLGSTLIACYMDRGDLTRANLLATRLTGVAELTGSRAGRGAIYWNAGIVAESRGQTPEALALVERALVLMAEDDGVRHLAMLKHTYGWLMLHGPKPDAARSKELILEAQAALAEVGSTSEQADCEIDLAFAELHLGESDSAFARAQRALGLIGSEPRPEAVMARVVMARSLLASGDVAGARNVLTTAERQLGHLADSRRTAGLWRHMGDLWERCERPAEAGRAYREALSMVGLRQLPMASDALSGSWR
ncbi:helix-turn-helix domain-containing protein [Streptomyces sp. NPDC006332]|uniref:helix-turn-helix domain-containing protein n=1 Tax=Streptomyces sp. NPDC006332 TaxID=3155456 RepID=UPI0033AFF925